MPTLHLTSSLTRERTGITVRYIKTTKMLDFSGWYDTFIGIEGGSMSLREFFERLGITKSDCRKAFEVSNA